MFDIVAEATGNVWTVERVAAELGIDLDNMTGLDRWEICRFYRTQVLTRKV